MTASIAAPRETRGQTLRVADKEQAQRTRSKKIFKNIKRLKDLYGQNKSKDAKSILYGAAARLF
jgi:hypothetical protein